MCFDAVRNRVRLCCPWLLLEPEVETDPALVGLLAVIRQYRLWNLSRFYVPFIVPVVCSSWNTRGWVLGFITALLELGRGVAGIAIGKFVNHRKLIPFILTIGGITGGIGNALLYLSIIIKAEWLMCVAMFTIGVQWGIGRVTLNTIIGDYCPTKRRTEYYGKLSRALGVGALIGGNIAFPCLMIVDGYTDYGYTIKCIPFVLLAIGACIAGIRYPKIVMKLYKLERDRSTHSSFLGEERPAKRRQSIDLDSINQNESYVAVEPSAEHTPYLGNGNEKEETSEKGGYRALGNESTYTAISSMTKDEAVVSPIEPETQEEKKPVKSNEAQINEMKHPRLTERYILYGFVGLLVLFFGEALQIFIIRPFIIVYLTKHVTSNDTYLIFAYSPGGILAQIIAPIIGRFADNSRLNTRYLLALASCAGCCVTVSFIYARAIWQVVFIIIVDFTSFKFTDILITQIFSAAANRERGFIFGLTHTFYTGGALAGPVIGGLLWDFASHKWTFWGSVIVQGNLAFWYIVLFTAVPLDLLTAPTSVRDRYFSQPDVRKHGAISSEQAQAIKAELRQTLLDQSTDDDL